MAQFATDTRRWLEAIIKQRKVLVKLNKSFKPEHEVMKAIHSLETLLSTYSYSNDLHMARFFHQNYTNICTILPGKSSACHEKRHREMRDIHLRAIQIIASNIEFKRLQSYGKLF